MREFAPMIENSDILSKLSLKQKEYILLTAHRSENVDNRENLKTIIDAMGKVAEHFNLEVIYPMHPRTKSKLSDIEIPKNIRIMAPLGFYDFNHLLKKSYCSFRFRNCGRRRLF